MAAEDLTMVGQREWLVTLGRFDLHAQVATMSRFRAAPRQGHMDILKTIYSYAIRTREYAIRFRTDQPDYSFLPDQNFDWTYCVYSDVHEINRSFTIKHTHPVDVWVKQGYTPC